MQELVTTIAHGAVTLIHAMALLILAFGSVQAFLRVLRAIFDAKAGGRVFHTIYIQYAHWLVGGLTFQLAADIIETSISPSWDEIGRLAAISLIRTFINFFLERDLAEEERRAAEMHSAKAAAGVR